MTRRSLLAVATLAVLATGCNVALPGTQALEPPAAAEDARAGGRLRVAVVQPAGVDPLDTHEPGAQLIAGLVCEPLVSIHPTTGEVLPGLARRVQVAGDGTTVTIELHRGARTHDGNLLQADDVLATLTRLASPASASRVRSLLADVQGYEQLATDLLGEGTETLTGAVALADLAVQITLERADPAFPRVLAHAATAPVSKEALAEDPGSFRAQPVCAGPYRPTGPFDPAATTYVVERFEDYHGRNPAFTVGGAGYADIIEFRLHPDAAAAVADFAAGAADVVALPGDGVADAPAGTLLVGPGTDVEFLGIPFSLDGPFRDPAVRRTLSAAIDRQELIRRVWHETREPATGFLPPALAEVHRPGACPAAQPTRSEVGGLPDEVVERYADIDFDAYDRAMGELWESAADGFASVKDWEAAVAEVADDLPALDRMLPIHVNVDHAYPAMALELARQWRGAFGIAVFPRVRNWQEHRRAATDGAGFDGLFRISWSTNGTDPVATLSDPQTFLGPLFRADAIGQGNWARWSNRQFELDLDRYTVGEADDMTRRQRYQDIEDLLCEELPLIPLTFGRSHWLVGDDWAPAGEPAVAAHDGQLLLRELYRRGQE